LKTPVVARTSEPIGPKQYRPPDQRSIIKNIPPAQVYDQEDNDSCVKREEERFHKRGILKQLIKFQWDKRSRGNDWEEFGPSFLEKQTCAFSEEQSAGSECQLAKGFEFPVIRKIQFC
jgi:hypothetical protein